MPKKNTYPPAASVSLNWQGLNLKYLDKNFFFWKNWLGYVLSTLKPAKYVNFNNNFYGGRIWVNAIKCQENKYIVMKKVWNMFRVNNEDTRMTSLNSLWCLYCYFRKYFPILTLTLNKQIPAGYKWSSDLYQWMFLEKHPNCIRTHLYSDLKPCEGFMKIVTFYDVKSTNASVERNMIYSETL